MLAKLRDPVSADSFIVFLSPHLLPHPLHLFRLEVRMVGREGGGKVPGQGRYKQEPLESTS